MQNLDNVNCFFLHTNFLAQYNIGLKTNFFLINQHSFKLVNNLSKSLALLHKQDISYLFYYLDQLKLLNFYLYFFFVFIFLA